MTRPQLARSVVARRRLPLGSEDDMKNANIESIRRAAIAGIVGATATAIGGLVVQAVVQPASRSRTSDGATPGRVARSFPSRSLRPPARARLHRRARVRAQRPRRPKPWRPRRRDPGASGHRPALRRRAGIDPVRAQQVDDTGAEIVGAIFGIAILLSAVGFLAAGVATLRARLWSDWRRFTPLAVGIWTPCSSD